MEANDDIETKAGHPPAMKVGGKRIVQRHRRDTDETASSTSQKSRKSSESDDSEEVVVKVKPPKQQVMISGVMAKVERDYPTEEVQKMHEKPGPTRDITLHQTKPVVIHQPRK